MLRTLCPILLALLLCPSSVTAQYGDDVIVFTANQGWMSRIYVLSQNGAVLDYFHYDFYIFSDLEVVENEVYVTDWVAPRVYRVDIETGELEVVVDDWTLIYMYDVASDGAHFFCKEWSLHRYALDGTPAGSAPLNETVRGGAWDGSHYWTLNDTGGMRCWDLSAWPAIQEIPSSAFNAPSPSCRGLWFDGSHFWTAESIEGALGYIYTFDHDGAVVQQWLAPAFRGYAAALVSRALPGDVNGDGQVDVQDLLLVLGAWGPCPGCPEDIDGDGTVGVQDLLLLLANWTPRLA